MINRIVTVAFVPLLAVYIGWSIQPLPGKTVSTSGSQEMWPEPEITQFHANLDDPSLAPKVPSRDTLASNR